MKVELSSKEKGVKDRRIKELGIADWRAEELVREKSEQMRLRQQMKGLKELEK